MRASKPNLRLRGGRPVYAALAIILLTGATIAPPQQPGQQPRIDPDWEYPSGPWATMVRQQDPYAFEFRRALKSVTESAKATRQAIREGRMGAAAAEAAGKATAVTGSYLFPVILGSFADNTAQPFTPDSLNTRLWTPGYTAGGHQGSVNDYYNEVSYGALTMTGSARGYAQADSAVDKYRDPGGDDPGFGLYMVDWIDQAIAFADPSINFADYDGDGDGYVDTLVLVHNMIGMECGGVAASLKGFWSHRWYYEAATFFSYRGTQQQYFTQDDDPLRPGQKIKISDYVMQPLLRCGGGGTDMIEIGVFCHELGHAFGLPDFYDIDGSASGGDSEGLGHWALMASGNYQIPTSPAHMTAYSREELGWLTYLEITDQDTLGLDMPQIETTPFAVKLHTSQMDPLEYFVIENRQAVGFDQALHSPGLVIYHMNDEVTSNNRNPADLRWAVEQADGLHNLEFNINRGDSGDPWPGSTNNTLFGYETSPDSKTRSGNDSFVEVSLLTGSQSTMTVDIIATPAFTLSDPEDAYVTTDTTPLLDWTPYSPSVAWGTLMYEVQVDTLTDFSTAALDTAVTDSLSWTGALIDSKTYYWRVRAFDDLSHERYNSLGYRSFIVDNTGPGLTLGALRNPLLQDNLDVYLVGSEAMSTATLTIDSVPQTLTTVPGGTADIRVVDYTITGPGTIALHGEATDGLGNASTADADLTIAAAMAARTMTTASSDGGVEITIPAGTVVKDGWALIMPRSTADPVLFGRSMQRTVAPPPTEGTALSRVYHVDLPDLVYGRQVSLTFRWTSGAVTAGDMPAVWHETDGGWVPLPTAVDLSRRTAQVKTDASGLYQLRLGGGLAAADLAGPDLEPAWPNPFNPTTQIAFTLPEAGPVKLTVYNTRGQKVRSLWDGEASPGRHVVTWDGKNDGGRQVASGIYLYVLETSAGVRSRKVTLIR